MKEEFKMTKKVFTNESLATFYRRNKNHTLIIKNFRFN